MNLIQRDNSSRDSLSHELSLLAAEINIGVNKKCHVCLQADIYYFNVDFISLLLELSSLAV